MGTPRRKKRDFAELALDIVRRATSDEAPPVEEDSPKVRRARKAGKAGGPARAKALSPERRSQIARRAALARWERANDAKN